jgi:hypothetical protein
VRDEEGRAVTARPSFDSGTVHVVAAGRIARLVIAGFGLCDDCGFPLLERQKIALLTSALLEFDGVQQELEGLQRVEHLLEELRAADRRSNGGAGERPGDEL